MPEDDRALPLIRLTPIRAVDAAPGVLECEFTGHGRGAQCVAWSSDRRRLATAGADSGGTQSVKVWDPDALGEPLAVLDGLEEGIGAVAWSPDGRRLAVGSGDVGIIVSLDPVTGEPVTVRRPGSLRVWDPDGPAEHVVAPATGHAVMSVAWSPDGRRLASAGDDGTVGVWDPDDLGEPLLVLDAGGGALFCVAWSPDGRVALGGMEDGHGRLGLWDARETAPPHWVSTGTIGNVLSVAWSPDGQRLAFGDVSGTVGVGPDSRVDAITVLGADGPIWSLAWSPDGRRLAAGSGSDGEDVVWVWSPNTATEPSIMKAPAGPGVRSLAWSPDGRHLAACGSVVRIWKPAAAPTTVSLPGFEAGVRSVAWSPDGRRLATTGVDGTLRVWDPDAPEEPLAVLGGGHGGAQSIAWSPDRRRLASGGAEGAVWLWDGDSPGEPRSVLGERGAGVGSLAWSPDGGRLATTAVDGTLTVWDPDSQLVVLGHLEGGEVPLPPCVAWSPDGRRLASGGAEGAVRLWDADMFDEPPSVLGRVPGWVSALAWSPDGRRVATPVSTGGVLATERGVWIWDADAPAPSEPLAVLGRREGLVLSYPSGTPDAAGQIRATDRTQRPTRVTLLPRSTSTAWSPDGRWLASGGMDGTVRVVDVSSPGEATSVVGGHDGGVLAVAWSPDGRRLASAGVDIGSGGTVRVWDPANPWDPEATLGGQDGAVFSLAWSPEGRRLALGTGFGSWGSDTNGTVRLWSPETSMIGR